MTVIRELPRDPTDLVIQGEQARAAAMKSPVGGVADPIAIGLVTKTPEMPFPMIAGYNIYPLVFLGNNTTINGTKEVLTDPFTLTLVRGNACICTPNGNIVPIPMGLRILNAGLTQSTELFAITGSTLDKNGAAVASAAVIVEETGRQNTPGVAVVARGDSDGSGEFSIYVPLNTAYQLIGSKTGAPDIAGITKNTIVPGVVHIYMRDPTSADAAGAGSRMSRARVVNT